jgi:hypothetical protein
MKDAQPKSRSRVLLLSHIAQFSLAQRVGGQTFGLKDCSFEVDGTPQPGDLIAMKSAPPSKWYLSWVVSVQRPKGWSCDQYTLESIEDGELCDWHNIGLLVYSRQEVANHPNWRWTNKQHELYDRWRGVCFNDRNAYLYLPTRPEFTADGKFVTLGVRVRFGIQDGIERETFAKWPTKKQMLDFYDRAVAVFENQSPPTKMDTPT